MTAVSEVDEPSESGPPLDRGTSLRMAGSAGTATRDAPEERAGEITPWPRSIGRFDVRGILGTGGMGIVLEAHDPELGRPVAIKLLRAGSASRNARLRLLREAQAMARLSHPNVVQIYDVGTLGDDVFLAMELIRGSTVERWLKARHRSWREILEPFLLAGRGLAAAHAVGLVHRDFKPSNVLMAEDGRVVVADFGVAAYVHDTGDRDAGTDIAGFLAAHLTATGAVVGTPLYMAPEQYSGDRPTSAADQFSFCVALFEALYGKLPFEGPSLEAFAANVIAGTIVIPERPEREIPAWISEAVLRGLQVDPAARHAGITELLTALQDDPEVRRRARTRRVSMVAGAVTLLGLAGWGVAQVMADAPCAAGAANVAAVWNDDRRAEITNALRADPDDARALVGALDQIATSIATTQDEQCAVHRSGELSSALFDASLSCLEQRRASIEDFVDLMTGDDAPLSEGAREVVARFSPVEQCRDASVIGGDAPPPDLVDEVTALRRRIAAAEMSHDAGNVISAKRELEGLAGEVAAIGYPPLVAELDLAVGRKAIDRMDLPEANLVLARAARQALASKADGVAAEAMTRRLYASVRSAERVEDVLADFETARGLVERLGSPAALSASLENSLGVAKGMMHDGEGAAAQFLLASEIAGRSASISTIDRIGYLANAAMHEADSATRDGMFDRVLAMANEALGPRHPFTVDLAARRAKYIVDAQRALEIMVPMCIEVQELAAHGARVSWCPLALLELHEALGNTAAALAALGDAHDTVDRERGDGASWEAAKLLALDGHRALLEGNAAAALKPLADARAAMEPHRESPWIALELAEVELLEARAHVALAQPELARPRLTSSIAVLEARVVEYQDQPSRRSLARAKALLASLP